MKIILSKDVPGLGQRGDVKEVAAGYGRNFLLPRKWAALATKGSMAALKEQQKRHQEHEEARSAMAGKLAKQLSQASLTVPIRTGQGGRVFGSITAARICQAIQEQYGLQIDKKMIRIKDPLRSLGTQKVAVKLHPAHTVQLSVQVVAEEKVSS